MHIQAGAIRELSRILFHRRLIKLTQPAFNSNITFLFQEAMGLELVGITAVPEPRLRPVMSLIRFLAKAEATLFERQ